MRHQKSLLSAAIAAILMSGVALGNDPADQPDPEVMADDTWISLTGQVESVEADRFLLDYGDGNITVEMDDWDAFGDAWPLVKGDQVTVYGDVDAGLFQDTRIEAGSVYVKGLNTFFYASAADEEEMGYWVLDTNVEYGDLTYIGTVETVSPATDSFTIDTGALEVTVFTAQLPYDPLDEEGFQQIEPGDRVSVNGRLTADFIGDADLFADSIVTLSD